MVKGKRYSGWWGLLLLLALAGPVQAAEVKGKVKAIAGKAKTISLAVEGKGIMVFKFSETTAFKNARDAKEIHEDDAVAVDYQEGPQGNMATVITRAVVKLPPGVAEIKSPELALLVRKGAEAGNYLLVDSRPAGKYHESHIPTAVSIPFAELEKQREKLLPADREKPLIFYCGGLTCVLSPKSAAIAQKLGYRNIRVLAEGEPGWKKGENPTESTVQFVKSGAPVVIDLRGPAAVAAGHIPAAVGIPADRLAGAEKLFPSHKGAPIVFYGEREADLAAALEQMRDWGYGNATLLEGGMAAWQAAGNALQKGPAAATISYTRKLAAGEVATAEFKRLLDAGSALVVDARSAEEFDKGHFKGAVNIPAEEMTRRTAELPRDRPVLVHCSTGSRAEMAYDVVKGQGYNLRFLKAAVEFGSDGKYTIVE